MKHRFLLICAASLLACTSPARDPNDPPPRRTPPCTYRDCCYDSRDPFCDDDYRRRDEDRTRRQDSDRDRDRGLPLPPLPPVPGRKGLPRPF